MTEKLQRFLDAVKPWQALAAIIAVILGGYFAATAWVRTSAQNAVLNEKFLSTLAARVTDN